MESENVLFLEEDWEIATTPRMAELAIREALTLVSSGMADIVKLGARQIPALLIAQQIGKVLSI